MGMLLAISCISSQNDKQLSWLPTNKLVQILAVQPQAAINFVREHAHAFIVKQSNEIENLQAALSVQSNKIENLQAALSKLKQEKENKIQSLKEQIAELKKKTTAHAASEQNIISLWSNLKEENDDLRTQIAIQAQQNQ